MLYLPIGRYIFHRLSPKNKCFKCFFLLLSFEGEYFEMGSLYIALAILELIM